MNTVQRLEKIVGNMRDGYYVPLEDLLEVLEAAMQELQSASSLSSREADFMERQKYMLLDLLNASKPDPPSKKNQIEWWAGQILSSGIPSSGDIRFVFDFAEKMYDESRNRFGK
jgi:hypothetical protein